MRIRVVRYGKGAQKRHGTGADRALAIQQWLDAQPQAVIDRVARALQGTQAEAGDCLENLGLPRTWRKQMRVEAGRQRPLVFAFRETASGNASTAAPAPLLPSRSAAVQPLPNDPRARAVAAFERAVRQGGVSLASPDGTAVQIVLTVGQIRTLLDMLGR